MPGILVKFSQIIRSQRRDYECYSDNFHRWIALLLVFVMALWKKNLIVTKKKQQQRLRPKGSDCFHLHLV